MEERIMIPGASQLMQRVRAGDKAALRDFVSRFGSSIYTAALEKKQNPLEARAIAKATLLDIIETPWCEEADDAYASWILALIDRNAWQNAEKKSELPVKEAPPAAKPPRSIQSAFYRACAAPSSAAAYPPRNEPHSNFRAPVASDSSPASAAYPPHAEKYDNYRAPVAPPSSSAYPPRAEQSAFDPQQAPYFSAQYRNPVPDGAAFSSEPLQAQKQTPPPFETIWEELSASLQPDDTRSAASAAQNDPRSLRKRTRAERNAEKRKPVVKDASAAQNPPERGAKQSSGNAGYSVLTVFLALIVLVLLWGILGVLAGMELLPPLPFGYDWFNQNIFPLF